MFLLKILPNRHKGLDIFAQIVFNNSQTDEAEIKPEAHAQRVPGAENGAGSGTANGPPRAG